MSWDREGYLEFSYRQVLEKLNTISHQLERAQQGELETLSDASRQLTQLRLAMLAESNDPLRGLVLRYRACEQDLERGELLYCSGYEPAELSSALGITLRRIYQLLRLARLPADFKQAVRQLGISERRLRPLLASSSPERLEPLLLEQLSAPRRRRAPSGPS